MGGWKDDERPAPPTKPPDARMRALARRAVESSKRAAKMTPEQIDAWAERLAADSVAAGEIECEPTPPEAAAKTRPLVLVESPFASRTVTGRIRNHMYLKAAMRDCVDRGEAPFASHMLYTQFLDDDVPDERAAGIECGLAWGSRAEKTVVYEDFGISKGMQIGIDRARQEGRVVERRTLPDWKLCTRCGKTFRLHTHIYAGEDTCPDGKGVFTCENCPHEEKR